MAPASGVRGKSGEDFEGGAKVVGAGEVVDEVGLPFSFLPGESLERHIVHLKKKNVLRLFQVIMNTLRVSETLSHLTVHLRCRQSSATTWFITMMMAVRSRCTLWMRSF